MKFKIRSWGVFFGTGLFLALGARADEIKRPDGDAYCPQEIEARGQEYIRYLGNQLHLIWQTAERPKRKDRYKPAKGTLPGGTKTAQQVITEYLANFPAIPEERRAKYVLYEDILALDNDQLHANNSRENSETARVAFTLVAKRFVSRQPINLQFVEKTSKEVHRAWVERNGSWAPPEQMLDYDDPKFTEEERQRDRDPVFAAINLFLEPFGVSYIPGLNYGVEVLVYETSRVVSLSISGFTGVESQGLPEKTEVLTQRIRGFKTMAELPTYLLDLSPVQMTIREAREPGALQHSMLILFP